MEVALYVRVSTIRQQHTQTIAHQLDRLRAHVATQPEWHVAEEHVYCDDGYSGATLNRPGLDRLRDRAAFAAFALVLMTAPDRLARNYVHQMLLLDELTQRGCQVMFVERPMSDDPHDQLLLQIRGAVAEYERTLIADRMRRGRHAKLRSGHLVPWTVAPYGYLLDTERPRDARRIRIDPVKAAIVTQMFTWYTEEQPALSLYGVAKRLSDARIPTPTGKPRWNVASVRGILQSSAYMGIAYSGRTRVVKARQRKSALQPVGRGEGQQPTPPEEWIAIPVPAIISPETFERAQERLKHNRQGARRNNTSHEYLLRGLVSCGQCHLACAGRALHPGYAYYVCRGRTDALRAAQGERCIARYAPAHALETLVWQDLCRVLQEPAVVTHELQRAQAGEWLPQTLQARRHTLRQALAQLERQQARLLEVYLAEVIGREEFDRKHHEVTQTQHGLTQQLRQLEAQAQQQVHVAALAQGIEAFCRRLGPTLETLTFAQRRQLVELLIDRVIVTDGQVEIRYVLPTGPKGETTLFCHLRLDYLDLEPQAIIVHKWCVGQVQITAKQDDMGASLGTQVGLRDDDDIQRVRELLMEQLYLIETGLQMPLDRRLLQVLHGEVVVSDLGAILATGTSSGIGAGVGKVQRRIAAQLGNQMQAALAGHPQGVLVPKMPIQHQGGHGDYPDDQVQQGIEPTGDALEFRCERADGFGGVLAALRPARPSRGTRRFGLLGRGFGFASGFLRIAAHYLLDAHGKGAPLLRADQGQREEGQPRYWLAIETGKESIQAIGVFARFGRHDFVPHQQVDLRGPIEMVSKEHPKQRRPWQRRCQKALDGAITAPGASPPGEAQHRHTPRHHQHRQHNTTALTQRGLRYRGLETLQKC